MLLPWGILLFWKRRNWNMVIVNTDYISGKEVQKKMLLGYEVVLKGSTQ